MEDDKTSREREAFSSLISPSPGCKRRLVSNTGLAQCKTMALCHHVTACHRISPDSASCLQAGLTMPTVTPDCLTRSLTTLLLEQFYSWVVITVRKSHQTLPWLHFNPRFLPYTPQTSSCCPSFLHWRNAIQSVFSRLTSTKRLKRLEGSGGCTNLLLCVCILLVDYYMLERSSSHLGFGI